MDYGIYGTHRLMAERAGTEDMGRTTIQVSDELADELHERKGRGDSYEDVIWGLIEAVDSRESDAGATPDTSTPTPSERSDGDVRPESPTPDDVDAVRAAVEQADLPGQVHPDEAVHAVRAVLDYLDSHNGGTMREIVAAVMPGYALGYDVDAALAKVEAGERYRGAWWRRVVRPALEAHPDVEKPPKGGSRWRYRAN